eukprot:g18808.t1
MQVLWSSHNGAPVFPEAFRSVGSDSSKAPSLLLEQHRAAQISCRQDQLLLDAAGARQTPPPGGRESETSHFMTQFCSTRKNERAKRDPRRRPTFAPWSSAGSAEFAPGR